MKFPKDFIFGGATSAYQIEGAYNEDGRGLSVWDNFCRKDGAVKKQENGDIACDHYHKYKEDVDLFSQMALQSYRFSLSWSRILPTGLGKVNEKGIGFYDKLVDELLSKNIDPCITLFHWDFPLDLYHKGGWLNRDSSDWFVEYALVAQKYLGDRVKNWITQNEPQCYIDLGHKGGTHAPGDKLSIADVLRTGHHSLMAHGKTYTAMKQANANHNVGYAPVGVTYMPQDGNCAENIEATKKYMFGHHYDGFFTNSWWMDPVFFGKYPQDGLDMYGKNFDGIVKAGDMDIIGVGADFLGLNIYHGNYVDKNGELVEFPQGFPRTAMDWQVTPEALYYGPKYFYERYQKPIVITENGMAGIDIPNKNNEIEDFNRISFLEQYLENLAKATAEGVDVKAYYLWSLLDNFEWAEGYDKRFGAIYVDYQTQKRTLKSSAKWYRDLILSQK